MVMIAAGLEALDRAGLRIIVRAKKKPQMFLNVMINKSEANFSFHP